jgi:hypothetical protein
MPIIAESKEEDIIETIQILASPCSCNIPEIFKGEDILMKREAEDRRAL